MLVRDFIDEVRDGMSKTRTFDFQLSHDPAWVIEKARKAATGNGVAFEGDERKGRFAGHGIEGSYAIEGGLVTIAISRKPIVMPWSMIESSMRKFFV